MSDRQRILVVDNDRDTQRLLNRTLELEGFDTIIVDDGESALNLLGKLRPDLVILETASLVDDSLQILDQMRAYSNVPIIILTTAYEVESLRKALYHGADDYIRKPFGTRSFVARVRAKLRRSQLKVM